MDTCLWKVLGIHTYHFAFPFYHGIFLEYLEITMMIDVTADTDSSDR